MSKGGRIRSIFISKAGQVQCTGDRFGGCLKHYSSLSVVTAQIRSSALTGVLIPVGRMRVWGLCGRGHVQTGARKKLKRVSPHQIYSVMNDAFHGVRCHRVCGTCLQCIYPFLAVTHIIFPAQKQHRSTRIGLQDTGFSSHIGFPRGSRYHLRIPH